MTTTLVLHNAMGCPGASRVRIVLIKKGLQREH